MNDSTFPLSHRVAVVTGGESGIGRAIAIALARSGARVCISYFTDEAAANETLTQIAAVAGGAVAQRCDVGDPFAVDALFAHARSELGVVSILINAAGVPPREKRILDLTLDEWNATLRTNLTGPFLAATRFALALPLDQAGAIVNISSVHEEMPAARVAEYAAAKGGLRNLTRCLALELSDRNITVNAIAPGTILTQMNPDLLADPAALADHERTIPLGRAGTVDDVAGVAVFLAGPAARYMTGTTVTVDGGMLLNVDAGPVVR